jgi:hypothetical protein
MSAEAVAILRAARRARSPESDVARRSSDCERFDDERISVRVPVWPRSWSARAESDPRELVAGCWHRSTSSAR